MSILATDNFNGGNGGLGANWTTQTGSDAPQVSASVVQTLNVNVGSAAVYTAIAWPDDQYGQITLITLNVVTSPACGVLLRALSGAHTGYDIIAIGQFGATVDLQIRRWNAGSLSTLTSTGANQTVNSGDVLKGTVVGALLTLYLNGAPKLSWTDVSPLASGNVGLSVFEGTLVNGDAQLDTWEGGDVESTVITGLGRKHQGFIYARPYL